MNKGDIYKTKRGQTRHVLGSTAAGDVVFATRGKHPFPDYTSCQVQSRRTFQSQGNFVKAEAAPEVARVQAKFVNYIAKKCI